MQTFVVKLASGVAAFIASICLSVNHLKNEEITEAEKSIDFSLQVDASSRLGLRMTMTIIPVIGLFIAILYFKKKFILDEKLLNELSESCDEFLVHASDVEGKRAGIDEDVIRVFKKSPITVTYAGGVKDLDDIERVKSAGDGKVNVTVGSALDIFGGNIRLKDIAERI